MAISETTKQAVSLLKAQLRSQGEQLAREKAALVIKGQAITAQIVALKETYDALEADIAEPTVSEEPV